MEQIINVGQIEMPADMAMKTITSRITARSIEAESGVSNVIISYGISHKNYNGKPYYYTQVVIDKLQDAIRKIGKRLIETSCSLSSVTQEDSPLCYGEDIVDQMSVLRQTVKLSYIFEERMGKDKRWRDNRLSRSVPRMTGRISEEEILQINIIIKELALFLMAIKLK